MSLTGHKNLQGIRHYARMNLKNQGRLLARETISPELQAIIDNAADFEVEPNSHQLVTREGAVA
jgi:hypothetical protein